MGDWVNHAATRIRNGFGLTLAARWLRILPDPSLLRALRVGVRIMWLR